MQPPFFCPRGGCSRLVGEEAKHSFFEHAAGAGKCSFDAVAEGFSKLGGASANGQQHGMRGNGAVDAARETEKFVRFKAVRCGVSVSPIRLNRSQADTPRDLIDRAIDEEHGIGGGDVLSKVGGPLLARNHTHIGFLAESLFRPRCKLWTYAIVAAQGIAASKDKTTSTWFYHLFSLRIESISGLLEIVPESIGCLPKKSAPRHAIHNLAVS